MRKIKTYLLVILTVCCLSLPVKAFFMPPCPSLPPCPDIDAPTDVMEIVGSVNAQLQSVQSQVTAYMQTMSQQAKALLSSYVGKFKGFMGGVFKKAKQSGVPGSKELKKSKLATDTDPISVKEALYPLFFRYPVVCNDMKKPNNLDICREYQNKAKEFHQDKIIEIYTLSRQMETVFDELEQSIDNVESTLNEGTEGAESNEDANGAWKNAYNAYQTLNSVLKVLEELESLRMQYIAAQAIGQQIVAPSVPQSKKDKKAQNDDNSLFGAERIKMASAAIKNSATMAFAALSDDDDEPVYQSRTSFVETKGNMRDPYADNKENLELLAKVTEANNHLNEALEMHNYILNLPSYKAAYKDYEKSIKVHNAAIEALKKSEQCAIRYYGEMYENPKKMWNGNLSESKITDYDARKGISGWAVKAFTLAKAEDTGATVSSDDFGEADYDENADPSDLSSIESASHPTEFDTDANKGFKDAEKSKQVNSQLKESRRLAWNIGAEAAKLLAEDQFKNGENGSWGKAKVLFPMWKDTQSYYNQYVEGKYDSMVKSLEALNLNELALNVTGKLIDVLSEGRERVNNKEGLQNLKQKLQEDREDAVSEVDDLIARKKQRLTNLYNQKEKQIKALEDKERPWINKINSLQAQIDKETSTLQTLKDKKIEAEHTVTAKEQEVEKIYQHQLQVPSLKVFETTTETYKKDLNAGFFGKQSYNLYQGTYKGHSLIANAQVAKISAPEKTTESDLTNLLNNKENSTDFRSTPKVSVTTEKQTAQIKEVVDEPENDIMEKDIKTYTRVITSEKEIEAEEPDHLLLAQEELKEAREEVLRLTAEIPLLEQKIESLKQEQQAEKDKIEALKPEKEKVNQAYVTAAQEATNSYDMLIAKAEQDYSSTLAKINNIDLAQYYKKNFKIPKFDEYGNRYLFNLPDILTEAHTLLEDTKGAVREIVSEAVKQVLEINEKMYTREISSEQQQEQVKKVHSDLIDHLKNITDEDLVSFSSHIQKYASYSGVMSLLRNIYKAYITNDACQQDICKMADTDCFVSNNGKRRDFLSPAPVPQRPLPSVREVVFFDYSDYDSIPVNNGRLTREGILNNMTYIPWIWKRILTSPAYLEKDIDLSTVIKPSEARLANSGKYPCWYDDDYLVTSYDEDNHDSTYVIYHQPSTGIFMGPDTESIQKKAELKKKGYQQCQGFTLSFSKNKVTVYNPAKDVSGGGKLRAFSEFKEAEVNSELGYLFDYDDGIKYNKFAENVFKTLSDNNKNTNTESGLQDILYDQVSMERTQIGGFLKSVDYEQETLQNIAEAKVTLDETKAELKELFNRLNFVMTPDFDLRNESDYNSARSALLNYRNKKVKEAETAAQKLQGNDNEVIKERLDRINNLIGALKKDSEVLVSLGDDAADNSKLDEDIKAEKVNKEVVARQEKEEEKTFEQQLNEIADPYCAQMVDNI